jgi:hypothetical protein
VAALPKRLAGCVSSISAPGPSFLIGLEFGDLLNSARVELLDPVRNVRWSNTACPFLVVFTLASPVRPELATAVHPG